MRSVAVIGAGMAGLTAARRLAGHAQVTVFEKSHGAGGRMATRRAEGFAFDHGVQFFTTRSDSFAALVGSLERDGHIARWDATFVENTGGTITSGRQWDEHYPHFVGAPGMSGIGRALASGLDVHYGTSVASMVRDNDRWTLLDKEGASLGRFDWVISAIPAHQAAELLPHDFAGHATIATTRMRACFALMLGFEEPPAVAWQACMVKEARISWVSLNQAKPGRDGGPSMVILSTNAWADANLERDLAEIKAEMISHASEITGLDLSSAVHQTLHRWRYANILRHEGPQCFVDASLSLAACGDWCISGHVESAFLSAQALCETVEGLL